MLCTVQNWTGIETTVSPCYLCYHDLLIKLGHANLEELRVHTHINNTRYGNPVELMIPANTCARALTRQIQVWVRTNPAILKKSNFTTTFLEFTGSKFAVTCTDTSEFQHLDPKIAWSPTHLTNQPRQVDRSFLKISKQPLSREKSKSKQLEHLNLDLNMQNNVQRPYLIEVGPCLHVLCSQCVSVDGLVNRTVWS